MIGIIETELKAFCILENLKNKYPKINIRISYLKEDIDECINKLQSTCKIIIIPSNYNVNDYIKKYPNLIFVKEKDVKVDNSYLLNNKELISYIYEGNEKEIINVLNSLKIPQDKTIVINDIELLMIKSIIQELYPNPIISNIDLLIEEISSVINKNKIQITEEGEVLVV